MLEREPSYLATRFKENLKPLGRRIAFPLSSVILSAAAACSSGYATGERNLGDVNCDDLTNSVDAALILQKVAGLIDDLDCEENADTNFDGTTSAIDAALILQLDAGIIDEFSGQPD